MSSAGFTRTNNTCVQCLAGFYCPDEGTEVSSLANSSSLTQSGSATACQCLPGLYDVPGAQCFPCPLDTYCLGGTNTTTCPPNSTTLGLQGLATRSECVCKPGFYEDSVSSLCVQCPPKTFCSAQAKHKCPLNSSSTKGSTICTCNPGFLTHYTSSMPLALRCEACPPDAICRGGAVQHRHSEYER